MHSHDSNAAIYVVFLKFAGCSFLGEMHCHYLITVSQTKLLVDLSQMPGGRVGGYVWWLGCEWKASLHSSGFSLVTVPKYICGSLI